MSQTYIPVSVRRRVIDAGRHRCGYCLSLEASLGLAMEIDHIVPEAAGGETVEDNLWPACQACNQHKSMRVAAPDPLTAVRVNLFDPRRQAWTDHFAWQERGTVVVGLTPTGRATVEALQLNRDLLVRARRVWVAAGWHPPAD